MMKLEKGWPCSDWRIRISYFFLSLFVLSVFEKAQAQKFNFNSPDHGFTSWLPARSWEEALLSGNGTIGTMVMGRPHDETIILNHALLYLPASFPIKPINQASRLDEIRKLMLAGKYTDAAKIPVEQSMKEGYGGLHWTDPYMPAFDIKLNMVPSNITNYARSVNFETGECIIDWEDSIGIFQRKLFVSRADSIVVIHIKGDGKINCEFMFAQRPYEWSQREFVNNAIEETSVEASGEYLIYRSSFKRRWKGSLEGYEGVGRVIRKGGTQKVSENRIVIRDADEVLLLLGIKPNYDWTNSNVKKIKKSLKTLSLDYETLIEKHAKIHGELFNRVKLDLATGNDYLPDSEVMVLKARKKVTPAIIKKLFDASRYNILCATGTNPPNLQGIWNANWTPPWSSDFTQDGNLPVAISSFLCANMPELIRAYFDYQDRMLPYYRDNTRLLYGCRGIHIPSRTSTHGWDIHFGETWCMTFWTAGAGWAANFYYDYWLYTGDKEFLVTRAYPFMKEAALFYEDFLTVGKNGKYVFNPSYSPENNPANSESQACINTTMDVMVAKQLLRNCINAAEVLKTDQEKVRKWKHMLSKMPDYEINEGGALREWLWPNLKDNYAHRHVSHLYGLYDIIDPEIAGSPELTRAAKVAIEERMKIRRRDNGGEMVFGMAQMAFVAANLGEAETAEELINWMASWYWTNSLASLHNPGSLFNMDLSGGFPAAVIRTLVYSEPHFISLLPALPSAWTTGKIEGILLRGQIEIKSLLWDKKYISVTLHSPISQEVTLKLPGEIKTKDTSDEELKIKSLGEDSNKRLLELPENQNVTLKISIK
jgi:alpha-L-fucosidase 2